MQTRNVLAGVLLLQWVLLAPGSVPIFLRPLAPPGSDASAIAVAGWVGELGVKAFVVVGLPVLAIWVADLRWLRARLSG